MEAQVDTLCLLTQPKEGQQQFKNKKQPENQTVCKSNNQGNKEGTFIQTGRKGGDGHPGGEDSRQGGPREVVDCGAGWAKLQLAGEAADGGPGDRPHNAQFQRREIKPQTTD